MQFNYEEIWSFSIEYAVLAVLLMVIMFAYFRIAIRYKIIDKPNDRSSHTKPTIRGGGIIFPIAILCYAIMSGFSYPYLTVAVLLTGFISFLDDLKDLPRLVRFLVHILSACLILYEADIMSIPIILGVLAFVFIVFVINAYNFMDGINGITGFYSLSILIPLMLIEESASLLVLEKVVFISLVIFLFFNARKKAKCFAGDVGSVTIAVMMCFLIAQKVIATEDYRYLCFLTLYVVDTGLTIIQRIREGDKVLEAHRKHLFQVFSNELKQPHIKVALAYAIIQLILNVFLISTDVSVLGIVLTFVAAILVYIIIKVRVLKIAK